MKDAPDRSTTATPPAPGGPTPRKGRRRERHRYDHQNPPGGSVGTPQPGHGSWEIKAGANRLGIVVVYRKANAGGGLEVNEWWFHEGAQLPSSFVLEKLPIAQYADLTETSNMPQRDSEANDRYCTYAASHPLSDPKVARKVTGNEYAYSFPNCT